MRSAEIAARRHRFTIIDGFSHALDQVYDRAHFDHDIVRREQGKDSPDYVENVFHLTSYMARSTGGGSTTR
jgi:hypothetical protein